MSANYLCFNKNIWYRTERKLFLFDKNIWYHKIEHKLFLFNKNMVYNWAQVICV